MRVLNVPSTPTPKHHQSSVSLSLGDYHLIKPENYSFISSFHSTTKKLSPVCFLNLHQDNVESTLDHFWVFFNKFKNFWSFVLRKILFKKFSWYFLYIELCFLSWVLLLVKVRVFALYHSALIIVSQTVYLPWFVVII